MHKVKIIISVLIFAFLLSVTSIIKTQTRIIEKKIYKIDRKISFIKKDLHETQLDYSYLSSPSYLSKKIIELGLIEYLPMDFSRIYLSYFDFNNAQKKITIFKKNDNKKTKKK
tara:strand:+ start:1067 stop:1405 length:339 start_codon:yes stop_codon:yes gene_type:complete